MKFVFKIFSVQQTSSENRMLFSNSTKSVSSTFKDPKNATTFHHRKQKDKSFIKGRLTPLLSGHVATNVTSKFNAPDSVVEKKLSNIHKTSCEKNEIKKVFSPSYLKTDFSQNAPKPCKISANRTPVFYKLPKSFDKPILLTNPLEARVLKEAEDNKMIQSSESIFLPADLPVNESLSDKPDINTK